MPVCIEITCRDIEVSRSTRELVLAHSHALQEYADVIDVCHVIIRRRGSGANAKAGYSVSIDLILHDGRAVAACLRDRHLYFEGLRAALDEAFHELRCWLHDMVPAWRESPQEYVPCGCLYSSDPIDRPDDLVEPHIMHPALRGTHYFVG